LRVTKVSADGGLVVEEDAVAGVHAVGFAVVDGDPVGDRAWRRRRAPGVEGGGFLLRGFLDEAEEFAGAGLVEAGFSFPGRGCGWLRGCAGAPKGVGVGGVFGFLEADGDVALRGEVVDSSGCTCWMMRMSWTSR